MIDKSDVSALIQLLESSEDLREHLNIIDRESFSELVGTGMRPLLTNENLKRYHKLLPEDQKYFIKSIALAPISLDGEVIGSLNQADFSPRRFQPGIDTSRLEQLAVKVSICLSNVTAHEKLHYLAFHDALTGLLNRRVMETVLKREFYRAKRYGDWLSVVFLDMNDFKAINDRYGHDQGDEVLRYVAKNLEDMSRDSDVVARFAGDEFVFVLPKTSAESATTLMERIKTQLETHPLIHESLTIPISISFGVASTENSRNDTPAVLLKRADEMLYRAKEHKKSGAAGEEINIGQK